LQNLVGYAIILELALEFLPKSHFKKVFEQGQNDQNCILTLFYRSAISRKAREQQKDTLKHIKTARRINQNPMGFLQLVDKIAQKATKNHLSTQF